MRFVRATLFAILLGVAVGASAQSLEGTWQGVLNVGGQQLKLVLHLSKDKATLDSPDQGAFDIPAKLDLLTADSVSVSVPAIGASYSGHLAGETLEGVFKQQGYTFPLTLKRVAVAYNRPQTPKGPFEYRAEEVTFTNPTAHAELSGTLIYPKDFKQGVTPVAIMVTGSGLQNRDEEIAYHKPFLVIADYLAKRGVATLRYDDRSFGKSTGDATSITTQEFMEDARAGVDYLRGLKQFGKIGILGHSEGGVVAFMLGAERKVDFIVSLAGLAVTGRQCLVEQNRRMLPEYGATPAMTEQYIKLYEQVCDYLTAQPKSGDPDKVFDEMIRGSELPPSMLENLRKLMHDNGPMSAFIALTPSEFISQIHCPVLALNGDKDIQVTASENIDELKRDLPPNRQTVLKIYPGLNHLFQHCQTGELKEYASIEETISPEVLGDIATWINGLGK
jgi:putative lipoprotein